MSNPKSEFWWATVAGANCEPVEVTNLDGERVAYTCGCADPFYLDRPDCFVVLIGQSRGGSLTRPLTPEQEKAKEAAWQRKIKADARRGIYHGWRGQR